MFKRKHAAKDLSAAQPGFTLPAWDAGASRYVWMQQAIDAIRGLGGLDRVAVWLEPGAGCEDHDGPIVFRGIVWGSEGGNAPVEWTRLSGESPLPQELVARGRTVETLPTVTEDMPMLGVLVGLPRALWVPINGRRQLRGLILAGTRDKEKTLPRAAVETLAAQLSVLVEYEDERWQSSRRAADLILCRNVHSQLAAKQLPQTILKSLAEDCIRPCAEAGVGAVFAVLGKLQNGLPAARPSAHAEQERLLVLAASGETAWAHSVEQGPLETLWRQALREGRVVGTDSGHLPLAKNISRIVALPVESKSQCLGVLLAGIPRHNVSLDLLERLELRAMLAAQVMEVQSLAEAQLHAKSWQSMLLDSNPEAVLLIDRRGLLLGMSKGAKEMLQESDGNQRTSSGPRRFAEFFRPREWEAISRWISRESTGEDSDSPAECQAELSTGVPVHIDRLSAADTDSLAVKIRLVEPARSRGVKALEAELRQSLEWLQEGVVIFDEQGGIRAMNSRCKRILGISTENGRAIQNFEELVPLVAANAADAETFAKNWRTLASDGGRESQEELTLELPTPQSIERSTRPIRDEYGKKIGRVEIYQEFTARKIFQSRMVQTEKMASLGQRATGIVHELANPLTTILGNAQRLVLRDPAAGSNPEILRILEEAERASAVLRQLLYLSRETQPLRARISLHDLAERTVGLQRASLHDSSIELRLESDPTLPPVVGDFPQLQQALLNLLQNAQQAIEQSGKGSVITVRINRSGDNHIRLEVADDGPGIPAALQGRIYDPFFTTKPAGAGTGLGLSIALGFVRQNGGTLTYMSPKNGGATFVMEFPVAEGLVAVGRTSAPAGSIPRNRARLVEPAAATGPERSPEPARRILIVEDEPTVAVLIADVLRDAGLHADVMLDSPSALQRMERESYDLLICDLNMPGIDGQKLYRTLLERHYPVRGKVLFVTGDIVAPRSQEFLERYHLPHVAKPFRMEELMHVVQELLHAGRAVEIIPVVAAPKHLSENG